MGFAVRCLADCTGDSLSTRSRALAAVELWTNSPADLVRLLEAANVLCEKRPATVLRVAVGASETNSRSSVPRKDSGQPEGVVKS